MDHTLALGMVIAFVGGLVRGTTGFGAAIARWRVIVPISLAAVLTVPLGGLLLADADSKALRQLIAVTVIVFSIACCRTGVITAHIA